MTERDPELQRAVDKAVDELARRLHPFDALKDPDGFARRFFEDFLWPENWRPIPRTGHIRAGAYDPATAHRGAERARQALRGEHPE